jgi:hypothetical protein
MILELKLHTGQEVSAADDTLAAGQCPEPVYSFWLYKQLV